MILVTLKRNAFGTVFTAENVSAASFGISYGDWFVKNDIGLVIGHFHGRIYEVYTNGEIYLVNINNLEPLEAL